jgi:hypothetical protein
MAFRSGDDADVVDLLIVGLGQAMAEEARAAVVLGGPACGSFEVSYPFALQVED